MALLCGRRWTRALCALFAVIGMTPWASVAAETSGFVIANATIIDGAGLSRRRGAVRVRDGVIVEVGDVAPIPGEEIVDANGLVLAPGFIDTHSHHDDALAEHPEALAAVSQGITTIVVGQDGDSRLPLRTFYRRRAASALNLASFTGHGSLRARVMGDDYRHLATSSEVRAMARLLAADMRAGSLGLSTGLEYDPGIYAARSELVELARVAAAYGGRYVSHMRSEDIGLDDAIEEVLEIGRQANIPVHISHFKVAITDRWGQAGALLARLDAARADGVDVTADVYPYEYWQSGLTVLFPQRDFTDLRAAEFALTHLSTPDGMLISEYGADPSLVGQTIAQIARARGVSPAQTYLDLINESVRTQTSNSVIGRSMDVRDIEAIILWPHSSICTDGGLADRHPRGAGSFTRVLSWLVRDEQRLTLEEAVRKMTVLAAESVGIRDRGRIAPGMAADLVIFDPEIVSDRATIEDPGALSVGIERVWVNGSLVYAEGRATGALPGTTIRRGGDAQ